MTQLPVNLSGDTGNSNKSTEMKIPGLTYLSALLCALIVSACAPKGSAPHDISPNKIIPTRAQVEYQKMGMIGFVHFTINTFTDKEWGYGDESPALFNPSRLDVDQWVETAKSGGMKELILTAKHHDGFCLWPSKYTEHSIKNSPYKNGQGDLVGEFVASCRKHGLKVGLYLSPWDRNHRDYGKPEYIRYYRNQLRELLTQYGEINEIWFDGANGGAGYYGGANETRTIDRKTYYDWEHTFALVKTLQPRIMIFSDAGPDLHWIGNEKGFAEENFWSTIDADSLTIGGAGQEDYLNSGDPDGKNWIIGQCDVSIRPGWFYHQAEDNRVKSPQELVDIYYKSVGRNAVLLVNLPPDRRGLIHENDVRSLKAFRQILDETFQADLLKGAGVSAGNFRSKHHKFSPENVLDNNMDTYWATDDNVFPAELTVQLPEEREFDRILIREPVQYGQRVRKFRIEVRRGNTWSTLYEGGTIGFGRLIRVQATKADRIRLVILEANNTVAISGIGVFKSSNGEGAGF
ncbi:MAG: alpha-L-fucosidase [Saprospiraceae bacterium]